MYTASQEYEMTNLTAQGFLDLVNRYLNVWNLPTEFLSSFDLVKNIIQIEKELLDFNIS